MRSVASPASPTQHRMLMAVLVVCALGISVAGCETSAAAVTAATAETTAAAGAATTETTLVRTGLTTPAPSEATSAGLFDNTVVRQISVSFAEEDYDAMIQTYQESGEKKWIKATVTIDGETYENVGVRLKGNSSIMGLRGRAGGQGLAGGDASADSPETLPWLVDLDKYVDNQNHEGILELVVRSNTSETSLNEAVALDLLSEAGLASQKATYARFSVNGGEPVLRLAIENPDDTWMAANFDIDGALYKAESTGDYSYRGDDPGSYEEVFDQEAGKTNADLTPLIEFLDFINNSDEATFTAGLPGRLDVEAFATYLAMQELINNFDDIDGPGNNSYLYYDTRTKRFTVVAWDHNLAFGGMGGAGGQGGGPAGGFGGGPGGAQGPAGGKDRVPAQGQFDGRGGFGGKSNILVQRFKANPEWQKLYEDRLAQLRIALYESGRAAEILAARVAVLKVQAADLVDAATVDQEAASISRHFTAD